MPRNQGNARAPDRDPARHQIFLLSPANSAGIRASLLTRKGASFPLARKVQTTGAPIAEVFTFTSGLYFRGKIAYATRFARPPLRRPGALIIVPGRGLVSPDEIIDAEDMRELAAIPIDVKDARYRDPLVRDVMKVSRWSPASTDVVLLGSIASGKYIDVLQEILGTRLLFPETFVGRGDMSRGGLMLRSAASGEELRYLPVAGAVRRGVRPPRLPPLPRR